jgi:hypothetical protein
MRAHRAGQLRWTPDQWHVNINVGKRGCRDDVRPCRRVPARGGGWQLRRLTSGIGVRARQPQPAPIPAFRGPIRALRHLQPIGLPAPAANSARLGVGLERLRTAAPNVRATRRAATAHLRHPRSASHHAVTGRSSLDTADRAANPARRKHRGLDQRQSGRDQRARAGRRLNHHDA